MKVCLLGDNFKEHLGKGINRYGINLLNGLKREKIDVVTLSPETNSRMKRIFYQITIFMRLNDCDIYHAIYPAYALSSKINCVTFHDLIPFRFKGDTHPLIEEYYKITMRIASKRDNIISISSQTKEELVNILGVEKSKIEVINPGVEEKFKPLNKKRSGVGYLSAFTKRKDPLYALRVFKKLPKKIKVSMAGSGPLLEECMRMSKKKNIKVKFMGKIDESKIVDYYNSLYLLIYPSIYEGFGLPILEAQACGVPVLTKKEARIPREVKNTTIICEDENDMVEKIEYYVENKEEWLKESKKSIKYAKLFGWEKTVRKTIGYYKKIGENL